MRAIFSQRNVALGVSALAHVLLALVLFSIVFVSRVGTLGTLITSEFSSNLENELSFVDSVGDSSDADASFISPSSLDDLELDRLLQDVAEVSSAVEGVDADEISDSIGDFTSSDPTQDLEAASGSLPFYTKKGAASGRTVAGRSKGAPGRQGDATKESEDAVERGLDWLARHQLPDGGWAFDLTQKDSNGREGACNGRCSNSTATSGGTETVNYKLFPNRTAATAVALLPFLGAGYTHTETNKYQKTVAAGVRFLQYNAQTNDEGEIDFRAGFTADGSAYIQALCVLVCCEAYEMTKDPNLKPLASGGLKKIENAQLADGGWRYYFPGDLNFHSNLHGDTSALGWQMLALKSGISAGFSVRPSVAYRAGNFLDLVVSKDSRTYKYKPDLEEKKATMWGTTAVGVLIREYLGWEPGDPRLDAGAKQIAAWVDSSDAIWQRAKKGARGEKTRANALTYYRDDRFVFNLYFAYYAALALHNYGGDLWKTRFAKLRELLVETQVRGNSLLGSCESGSWLFYDKYMNDGGRLLNTSLAILILETPYRYLPMYQ